MPLKLDISNVQDPNVWFTDSDEEAGFVEFKHSIEDWMSVPSNMRQFKDAARGDKKAADYLPHWVWVGLNAMLRTMGENGCGL